MPATLQDRCTHILDAIANIRSLLDGRGPHALADGVTVRPAFERHLEIISEAIRYLPQVDKARHPMVPWADIAGLGNRLRHGYDQIRSDILWGVYAYELDALEHAVRTIRDTGADQT